MIGISPVSTTPTEVNELISQTVDLPSPVGAGAVGALASLNASAVGAGTGKKNATSPKEAARQFEAILVRQLLTESMKSLLESEKGSQVYGYFLTDALADGITKGGGLGLRSVIESQLLSQRERDAAAAQEAASKTLHPLQQH